jgi:hypothetical protein
MRFFFHRVHTDSGVQQASCPMTTEGSFPGGQSSWGVKLTTHLLLVSRLRMQHEGPLLCSQEPTIGPYPMQSTTSQSVSLRSVLILSSYLHLGLSSGIFSQVFRSKSCIHFWMPHSCCMSIHTLIPNFKQTRLSVTEILCIFLSTV